MDRIYASQRPELFGLGIASLIFAVFLQAAGQAAEPPAGKPHVIAHRGGSKWAPENTMVAFRKCLEARVYGIELDIHRCQSGELVVIHDDDLKRTTNGSGLVKETSYEKIRSLDAGSWFSPEFRGERIPLLTEVLAMVDGKMHINIEIKNLPVAYPGIEDDLLRVLKEYKHKDKIIISSFDHEVLRRLHSQDGSYRLAFLDCAFPADIGRYASMVGATVWHPEFFGLRADTVASAKASQLEVNSWTVNKAADWRLAVSLGIDGIITDDPAGLTAYLSE